MQAVAKMPKNMKEHKEKRPIGNNCHPVAWEETNNH